MGTALKCWPLSRQNSSLPLFLIPSPLSFLLSMTSRLRRGFMNSRRVLRVISTLCLSQRSVSLQFFRLCSFYGHFILVTNQSLTCSLQNRGTSPIASINSIILDARFIDEFNFFGSNGNPAPVCDDPLDTASQLESIDDDDYPPAQAPLDEFNPPSDSPIGNHMPDDTADDSVSVGIR